MYGVLGVVRRKLLPLMEVLFRIGQVRCVAVNQNRKGGEQEHAECESH